MSDFDSRAASNAAEFTVSEISGALKRVVEDAFGNVRVRGEISGYRGPHSSGHAYFALKDDRARMEAVIWKGTFQRLRFRPEEGMEVIATGKLTTYPGSSKYQIVIDSLEPAGAGALMALLEERRKRLEAEGLFSAARKRSLPRMPATIGVITSPTGAVIRDILHRITDRFPLHVLVWPVRVQGDSCAQEVTAAVQGFNAPDLPFPRPDVLIVARGGGSLEDLWGFNDEGLARAVAGSAIPVISAVGHETDTTLIDFVSDMRAPTPTGAAEIAVPVKAEMEAAVASLSARLKGAVSRSSERKRQALRAAARALPAADQLLALPRRRFDEAAGRIGRAFQSGLEAKRGRLTAARLSEATLRNRVAEARARLEKDASSLRSCGRAYLRHRRQDYAKAAIRLRVEPIGQQARLGRERSGTLEKRLDRATSLLLRRMRESVLRSDRLLGTLSYKSVLARGFAVVRDASGTPLTKSAEISGGQAMRIEFADGEVGAIAAGVSAAQPKVKPRRGEGPDGSQGSLL